MSHKHFCDVAGHPWQCNSSECICICQKPMELGDHSHCSIELRPVLSITMSSFPSLTVSRALRANGTKQMLVVPQRRAQSSPERRLVRLKPIPPEIDQKLGEWFSSESDSIGFCFLCGNAIPTEAISSLIQIPQLRRGQVVRREETKEITRARKRVAPKDGVFFVVDGKHPFIDGMPVNQVSGYGGFLIHEANDIL